MTDETAPIADASARASGRDCLRCGAEIASVGVERLRVGGSSGGVTALLGSLAELGEGILEVELLVCSACRHVEMRATDAWFRR